MLLSANILYNGLYDSNSNEKLEDFLKKKSTKDEVTCHKKAIGKAVALFANTQIKAKTADAVSKTIDDVYEGVSIAYNSLQRIRRNEGNTFPDAVDKSIEYIEIALNEIQRMNTRISLITTAPENTTQIEKGRWADNQIKYIDEAIKIKSNIIKTLNNANNQLDRI